MTNHALQEAIFLSYQVLVVEAGQPELANTSMAEAIEVIGPPEVREVVIAMSRAWELLE